MTSKEEIISNISYCASDFRTIFPQLLDTAKKLTNKWDPSLSNESDPGNILLKEAAIVADKNNYHVDKNVLECFPLSATQQSSARQIYDLVGYNMHWYRSAISNVKLTLLSSLVTIQTQNGLSDPIPNIQIKAGKQVTDTSGTYVYTLLDDIYLNELKVQKSVPAIQGIIKKYEINGKYNITIDNLDENLRLYFPQNMIAENGIYVFSSSETGEEIDITEFSNVVNPDANYWGLVDNLTQYPAGSKIFKFGLDLDSDNCYIQFPEYISDIIKSGVRVYYTISNGLNGNIKNSVLNQFTSPVSKTIEGNDIEFDNYISITNDASIGGEDPESLKEAYRNYKKLIGTYDTLVSRRDYQNAIFNLEDENNIPLLSNDIVTDRTSDHNFSYKVMINNGDRDYARNVVLKPTGSDIPYVQPYDIVLYLLRKPDTLTTIEGFNQSFKPDLSVGTKAIIEDEQSGIGEIKSVQHNLYYPNEKLSTAWFNINNLLVLKGNINTYYKVSKKEAKEIEDNVTRALIDAYNARELEFGEEIDFNEVLEIIKNADARILNVNLNIPQYEPLIQNLDGSEDSLYENDQLSFNDELIAKMVLSGNVQLFKFQNDFQYDFGQSVDIEHLDPVIDIATISTENTINVTTTSQALSENDIVQIVVPSFNVKEKYGSRVGYQATLSHPISNGELYQLQSGEEIKFVVAKAENPGEKDAKYIHPGDIIKPVGFSLENTGSISIDTNYGSNDWIRSGNYVEILDFMKTELKSGTSYYIVSNNILNDMYIINIPANGEYILQQDEYLIYLTAEATGIVILGSGTSLKSTTALSLKSPVSDLSDITSSSIDVINKEWEMIPIDKTLKVQENEIITLTQGDFIESNVAINLTQNMQNLSQVSGLSSITYRFSSEDTSHNITINSNITGYDIKGRCDFQLVANSKVAQKLNGNQTIIFNNDTSHPITASYSLLFNYPVNILGGTDKDVRILDEITGKYKAELKCYYYVQGDAGYYSNNQSTITRENGVIEINNKVYDNATLTFSFNSSGAYDKYIIPVNVALQNNVNLTVVGVGSDSTTPLKFQKSMVGDSPESSLSLNTGDKFIVVSGKGTGIKFTFDTTNATQESFISLGYMKQLNGLNSDEINSDTIVNKHHLEYTIEGQDGRASSILDKIEYLLDSISEKFDWLYEVPANKKVIQPLLGESYFNPNHFYNECTIAKIGLSESEEMILSEIKVNPSNIEV